jgi:mono/diheme cytochrome c family protein
MRCFTLMLVVVIGLVLGAGTVFGLGGYDVAADEPHWATTDYLLGAIRQRSIAARATSVQAPADLDAEKRIGKGAIGYAEMCAGCHLSPGVANTELREGLRPQPPDLVKAPVRDSKRAFWVIKHGIKMTGMPAWGRSHKDDQIWSMVAFLHKLPDLSPQRYRALTAGAKPGQHGQSSSHTH